MNHVPDRLLRGARLLRQITLVAAGLIALVIALSIWTVLTGREADVAALRIHAGGLSPWPAALALLLVGILAVMALHRLTRMLAKVEAGSPFGAAADLRGFASWLFLSLAASVLAAPLFQLAARLAGGPAGRIDLSISMTEALMLLVTGLLFFVARLLDEAQRVADDASQIV